MQIVIKGKNTEVSEPLREYVEKKLGKLDRYLDNISTVTVELSKEMSKNAVNRHIIQVTVLTNGTILRGEEKAGDPHSAVDTVADVLHRQITRYKEKLYRRGRTAASRAAVPESREPEEEQEELGPRIVKTKQFAYKPVTLDEAIDQMELLGHDFFIFLNSATDQVNVLYRRRDGDYGLIEPEI
ncbi:MAG: ribosome-associated translation inhibitor RaiA [Chloroflexi bacterium]|nr:ribosome-associated translation inhibitor RaiA [Chloroflexota bacterium]